MSAIIFCGPSLPPSKIPVISGVQWRPPVRQGDVHRASLTRPAIIGIVDGIFESVPTVWHKEILWAMTEGIHVYGAASVGALRAAELSEYGMIGIGDIYRQFQTGVLLDDDEVAVLHGPQEVDYVQVTEAMVNVRATISQALQLGLIEAAAVAELIRIAKSLFYKERTYETILKRAAESGLSLITIDRFAAWLPGGRIDQKRMDALEMVQAMSTHLVRGVAPHEPSFRFAHTFAWEYARRRSETAAD
jgi:hypothetical protein